MTIKIILFPALFFVKVNGFHPHRGTSLLENSPIGSFSSISCAVAGCSSKAPNRSVMQSFWTNYGSCARRWNANTVTKRQGSTNANERSRASLRKTPLMHDGQSEGPTVDRKANELTVTQDLDGYTYVWRWWSVTVAVARLMERGGDLHAEMTVRSEVQGQPKLLTQGRVNLSSLQVRERLAKRFSSLCPGPEWDTVVETVCVRTVALHRRGQPAESLEPQEHDQPACFVCNPLIYDRHPTLLYGPGESGKSFLALYMACLLASGGTSSNLAVAPGGHGVLYLDWEMRAPEMRSRVRQLRAGHPELTRAPLHRSMHLPLAACVPEIRREIHEQHIGVVIVDSLGPATGGEIERASDPVAFFNALGSLGCASLLIGHVAKGSDEEKSRTPYGSVYYYNLARSIWEVRLVSEPASDERKIALYHRKNNLGRRLHPLGYTMTITDQSARLEPCDPTEEPEFARGLTLRERIRRLLADHQSRTVNTIAEELSVKSDSVRKTLNLYKGRDWMSLSSGGGRGNEAEWGVL